MPGRLAATARKRAHDQLLRHAGIEGVTHQLAVEQVFDAGKVKPTLVRGDVGDVRHPRLVGGRDGKLAIQQVWRHRQVVLRIRGRLEFPLLSATQTEFAADALDAVNAYQNAVVGQVGLQALGAVGLSRPLVRRLDLDFQPRIRLRSP